MTQLPAEPWKLPVVVGTEPEEVPSLTTSRYDAPAGPGSGSDVPHKPGKLRLAGSGGVGCGSAKSSRIFPKQVILREGSGERPEVCPRCPIHRFTGHFAEGKWSPGVGGRGRVGVDVAMPADEGPTSVREAVYCRGGRSELGHGPIEP